MGVKIAEVARSTGTPDHQESPENMMDHGGSL